MDFDGHRDVFTKSTFKGVVALAVSFSELPQFVLLGQALSSDCPYPGLTTLHVTRLVIWDEPYILLNFLWGWQSIFSGLYYRWTSSLSQIYFLPLPSTAIDTWWVLCMQVYTMNREHVDTSFCCLFTSSLPHRSSNTYIK